MHPLALALVALPAQPITTDGDTRDWADNTYVAADGAWIYGHFEAAREITLHAAPFPVVVELDADGSTKTGITHDGMGVDLTIEFSPEWGEGERRWGPRIFSHEGGVPTEVNSMEIDFHVAPTFASRWFEFRIRRDALDKVLDADLAKATGVAMRVFSPGDVLRAPEPKLVARATTPKIAYTRANTPVPVPPAGAIRVMSWNVLWGSPLQTPESFARILASTRPDVVLLQEWDRGEATDADIASWFDSNASWASSWSVIKDKPVWGTAIATHHEVVERGPGEVYADGTRWDFPIRIASGAIKAGDDGPTIVFGSTHLKCCGHLGSQEDHRRLVEAAAINRVLNDLKQSTDADAIILGGDFNIDGTIAVLDVATTGLDADGTRLEHATPAVLGDNALYTFGRPGMNTERKRLDFITYPDAIATVANAFVIDTARLSPAALTASGLEATDSAASDHLPVVVDLLFKAR